MRTIFCLASLQLVLARECNVFDSWVTQNTPLMLAVDENGIGYTYAVCNAKGKVECFHSLGVADIAADIVPCPASRSRRLGIATARKWPLGTVCYHFDADSNFSSHQRLLVDQALEHIENSTVGIRFLTKQECELLTVGSMFRGKKWLFLFCLVLL